MQYYPTKSWQTKSPEEIGLSAQILADADTAMRKIPKVLSLLVVKDGYLAYEKYYNGADENTDLSLMSVTKSITSALVGIAIDLGFIKSVDQPVKDFFPDYQIKRADLFNLLTIKHLLTFTTGMHWLTKSNGDEPLFGRLHIQKDWIDFVLNLPINEKEISCKFQYNTPLVYLLSVIVARVSGMSAIDFAKKYLFEPLGIDYTGIIPYDYSYDPKIVNNLKMPSTGERANYCLNLKARDLAKFGLLYLNQGKWEGKQLVSAQFVADSTTDYGHRFGYLWDVREIDGHKIIERYGLGGQRLYLVPDFNLVAVINSKVTVRGPYPTHIMDDFIFKAAY